MAPSARLSMLAQDASASYPGAGYTADADPMRHGERNVSSSMKDSHAEKSGCYRTP